VAGYAGGTVAGRGDDGPEAVAAQPLPGNRRQDRLLTIYNWSDQQGEELAGDTRAKLVAGA
jgi:hypothetical protein